MPFSFCLAIMAPQLLVWHMWQAVARGCCGCLTPTTIGHCTHCSCTMSASRTRALCRDSAAIADPHHCLLQQEPPPVVKEIAVAKRTQSAPQITRQAVKAPFKKTLCEFWEAGEEERSALSAGIDLMQHAVRGNGTATGAVQFPPSRTLEA